MLIKTTPGGAPLVFPDGTATRDTTPNDLREMLASYRAGDMKAASEAFARLMTAIDKDEQVGHEETTQAEWARTVSAALGVFVQPDFIVPEEMAARVLSCCPLIANVLAAVGMNTDSYLKMIDGQPQHGYKSAVLYTPRNTLGMDFGKMLGDNPMLASMWLNQAVKVMYSANADKETSERMRTILASVDERLEPAGELQELYFLVSYLGDIAIERAVKGCINTSIKRHLDTKLTNTPNPRKVAVWAEYWNKGHSVYRTLKGFVDSLRPHFDEITLIHCVKKTEELDTTGFDRVIKLDHDGFRINPTPLDNNEWAAVVFADVGMTLPSILLSNMRIAPVQILLTGHPVSTFGGEMDWFISGAMTDQDPTNYSERLAILPHFGAVHEPVEYTPTGKRHGRDEIVINCSAYGQKIHHRFLATINEAFAEATKPVKLQLFCGNAPMRAKGLRAFSDAIAEAVPNAYVELIAHLPYADYMARIEEADFGIDNWPFGGSNVISDQIAAGVPVLCREGDRWFNSIGAAMVRSTGLSAATSRESFKAMLVAMLTDDDRQTEWRRVMSIRSNANVYDRSHAAVFGQFVATMALDPNYYGGTNPVWLGGAK